MKSPPATHLPVRIAIVEDDPEVRRGLRLLVNDCGTCACVADFGTAEEALAGLAVVEADVVLMDIQLPGMSGIECIRVLKRRVPHLQILMLTVFEDPDRIFQSLAAGASGYLLKQTPPSRLLEGIVELHRGGSPMSAPIARRLVEVFRENRSDHDAIAVLSPRERGVLELLAKGFLYKEIAAKLGLSVETVRTHIHSIYEKLHVQTRTEAVMKVYGRSAPG